jgi:hypothetical protein
MDGTLFQRTTDDGNVCVPNPRGDRGQPAARGSREPRVAWPLLGTMAATGLAMVSAVLVASRVVDVDALVAPVTWTWLAAPAVLGGLAFVGVRRRPAPSAAGRSAPTGGTGRAGREPPGGRRFAAGSRSRPKNQAWTEHIA